MASFWAWVTEWTVDTTESTGGHREGQGGGWQGGQTYSEHAVYKSCEAMTQASH